MLLKWKGTAIGKRGVFVAMLKLVVWRRRGRHAVAAVRRQNENR